MKKEERTADSASDEMLGVAENMLEKMEPECGFGLLGVCCRNCVMGQCRIDPFGEGAERGDHPF